MLDRVDALDVKQFRGRSVFYYQSIRPSIYKDNTFKRGYGNDMCFVEERTQQNGYKNARARVIDGGVGWLTALPPIYW